MGTRKITPAVRLLLLLVAGGIGVLILSISTSKVNTSISSPDTPRHSVVPWLSPTPDYNTLGILRHSQELWDLFYKQPGITIAEGTNSSPVGLYNLTTYRIEELTLPSPLSFYVREGSKQVYPDAEVSVADPAVVKGWKTVTVSTLWRVFIPVERGGVLNMSLMWSIYVNDVSIGTMPLVLYDKSSLHEGDTIGVSYGGGSAVNFSDKLHYSTKK